MFPGLGLPGQCPAPGAKFPGPGGAESVPVSHGGLQRGRPFQFWGPGLNCRGSNNSNRGPEMTSDSSAPPIDKSPCFRPLRRMIAVGFIVFSLLPGSLASGQAPVAGAIPKTDGEADSSISSTPFARTDFNGMCRPDDGWFSLSADGRLVCSIQGVIHFCYPMTGRAESTFTTGTRPVWLPSASSLVYIRDGFIMSRRLRPGRDPGVPDRVWSNSKIVDFVMSPRSSSIAVSCLDEGIVFNRLTADARDFEEAMTASGLRGHNLAMETSGDLVYFVNSEGKQPGEGREKLFSARISERGGARHIRLPGFEDDPVQVAAPSPGMRHLALISGQTPEIGLLDLQENMLTRGSALFEILGVQMPAGRPLHLCWEPNAPILWMSTTSELSRIAYLGRQSLDALPLKMLARQEVLARPPVAPPGKGGIESVETVVPNGSQNPDSKSGKSFANSPPSVRAGWKAFNAGPSKSPRDPEIILFGSTPLPGKVLSKFFSSTWWNFRGARRRIRSERRQNR